MSRLARRLLGWLSFGLIEAPADTTLERERDTLRAALARHNEALAAAAGQREQIRARIAGNEREASAASAAARTHTAAGRGHEAERHAARAEAARRERDALQVDLDAAEAAYQALAAARDRELASARERIDAARGAAAPPGADSPTSRPLPDDVRGALLTLSGRPGVAELAARGLAQQRSLADKRAGFERIAASKLNVGELTHARYTGAVERVCEKLRDNLLDAVDSLRLASDVAAGDLTRRVAALESAAELAGPEREELAALRDRLSLREAQLGHVESLLAENETAITAVVNVTGALTALRSLDRHGAPEMDPALRDLESLAERTHAYE